MTDAARDELARLAGYLREGAESILNDGTPAQVGPTAEDLIHVAKVIEALSAPPMGEAVAWQRLHPTRGWRDMDAEDVEHYRAQGQEVRALYALAQPLAMIKRAFETGLNSGPDGGQTMEDYWPDFLADNPDIAALATTPAIRESGEGGSFSQAKIPGDTTAHSAVNPCACFRCLTESGQRVDFGGGFSVPVTATRMVVCRVCGNKRCPHATDHRHACTGSNEPGQEGSRYR